MVDQQSKYEFLLEKVKVFDEIICFKEVEKLGLIIELEWVWFIWECFLCYFCVIKWFVQDVIIWFFVMFVWC